MVDNTLFARTTEWEVWVGKFQFDHWDAFVRRIASAKGHVDDDELVPGGPFPTRPEAGQAGIAFARKTGETCVAGSRKRVCPRVPAGSVDGGATRGGEPTPTATRATS